MAKGNRTRNDGGRGTAKETARSAAFVICVIASLAVLGFAVDFLLKRLWN